MLWNEICIIICIDTVFTENIALFREGTNHYPANTYKDAVLSVHLCSCCCCSKKYTEPMSLAGEEQALPLTMLGNLEEAGCILNFDKCWRIPSFLAAGTTTAKRFGCVAEGTTKAGWYRASGGRVLGCWTTLAKVENVFTMESSKSSKRWDYLKSVDADGIWWHSQNEDLQRSQECNTSVAQV